MKRRLLLKSITVLFACAVLTLSVLFAVARNSESPLARSEFGHCLSLARDMNRIIVRAEKSDAPHIQVLWNGRVVYVDSAAKKPFPRHAYGENIFLVRYGDEDIGAFVQYKYNDWSYADYVFTVETNEDSRHCSLEILGRDDWNDVLPLGSNDTGL